MTAQQINYIHGQLQRVIDENDLAMAVKNSLIELILHSHFKNQMETGTSQGANAPGRRAQLSAEYFGHGKSWKRSTVCRGISAAPLSSFRKTSKTGLTILSGVRRD